MCLVKLILTLASCACLCKICICPSDAVTDHLFTLLAVIPGLIKFTKRFMKTTHWEELTSE